MPDPLRPDVEARLLRHTDLIDLVLEAYNCHVEEGSPAPELVADDDARLVVHFPPQHIGEEAWQQLPSGSTTPAGPPGQPSRHRSAEPSRLVFAVPEGSRIPWHVDAVLGALPNLDLVVAPGATPRGEASGTGIEPPAQLETAIEAPYRIVVSPSRGARFRHSARPLGPEGRSELWRKGATSGHTQRVREVSIDCDGDTLLLVVDQTGPACHTGAESCFDAGGVLLADDPDEARSTEDDA